MSKLQVRISELARQDLRKHVLWIRQEADPQTAKRFSQSALDGFARIAETPAIGPAIPTANPALFGLRKWRVRGFPKFLVFYRTREGKIEIVRVFHASQDWWALLDVN